MTSLKSNNENRNFGLDLFRAIAVLFVVFVHSSLFLNGTALDGFPYISMIDGVDLFFVLSGFLIGGILLKEINAGESFGTKQLFRFWKRRWFRTLPAYYLILLANFLVVKYKIIDGDINQCTWKNLVFLHNFSQPAVDFFWESWSLSVEEWFYLLSPLLLLLFLKITSRKSAFLTVTVLMLVFSLAYRIALHTEGMDGFWIDVTFRKMVVTRLDSIAFGLLAAWVFYYYRSFWDKSKYIALIAGIGLIVFILNFKTSSAEFYNQVFIFSITPFAAMLLLPFAQSLKHASGLVAKAITHISKISYAMYLLNLGLMVQVLTKNHPDYIAQHGILVYFFFWFVLILASTLVYRFFEKPLMDLRDKF